MPRGILCRGQADIRRWQASHYDGSRSRRVNPECQPLGIRRSAGLCGSRSMNFGKASRQPALLQLKSAAAKSFDLFAGLPRDRKGADQVRAAMLKAHAEPEADVQRLTRQVDAG
jgi:hypothetical protein